MEFPSWDRFPVIVIESTKRGVVMSITTSGITKSHQSEFGITYVIYVVYLLIVLLVPRVSFGDPENPHEDLGPPQQPPGWDAGPSNKVGQSSGLQLQARRQARRKDGEFQLVEATIKEIHDALRTRQISCENLTKLYFKRIKAYSGHCVKYDTNGDGTSPDYDFTMPSGKGVFLGVVNAINNAGQIDAIQSVNLRPANYTALGFGPPDDPGPRSEADPVDDNPALPDALEVARALDRAFRTNKKLRPLHCIPMVIKDQMETIDMRTTDGSVTTFINDRPPNDGTLVKKLRDAGAIIIAKAAMDEYAGGSQRSSYSGQPCNPYATDRNGGSSSTGSATAPSANLAVCGIAEEQGGSIRNPAKFSGVVGMTPSRGLVSRFGTWGASLHRERFGPECRTVEDLAKVLDVIRGYDPKDPITATQIAYTPSGSLAKFANGGSLVGKRIGIIREFMPNITINDTESIRVFNEEVVPTLLAAGATLVESVNPRDVAKGWAMDDPSIPNMSPSIQDVVAEMVPTLIPSFANPSTLDTPSITTGLLPSNLREVFGAVAALLFPDGTDVIQKSVEMFFGITPFPEEINLRKLNNTPPGTVNQGRYILDVMLHRRGDPQVTDVTKLSIDFNDLNGNGVTNEHLSYFAINAVTGLPAQRARPGVTPSTGVMGVVPNGLSLDTQGQASHLYVGIQATREVVARILADNDLEALVYPHSTIPAPILTGTIDSIPWLAYDGRPAGGITSFTDASGLPDIGVPAGFTKVVYDRTTRGNDTEALALDPPSVVRDVALPFGVNFISRMWSDPVLLEIASGYEAARGERIPPSGFGSLPGEP
jgi:amidase